jgi:hypothetical protein
LVVGLAACGEKNSADKDQNGPPPIGDGPLTPEQRYGQGPVKDPNVTLQPDVVLVDGGPKAIKEASANGTSWTLDGHAGGVKDLAPGKILFASRLAVGRVVTVENVGDDRKVQLAPVQLTDIVRDGHLKVDQAVDFGQATAQQTPDLPYASTVIPKNPQTEESDPPKTPDAEETDEPSNPDGEQSGEPADPQTEEPDDPATDEPEGGGAPAGVVPAAGAVAKVARPVAGAGAVGVAEVARASVAAPGVRTVAMPEMKLRAAGGGLPAPINLDNENAKVQLGNWELTPFRSKAGIGLRAFYAGPAMNGLKGGVTLSLDFATPKVKVDLPISGGAVGPTKTFTLSGLEKLSINVNMGSGGGLRDNQRLRLEVPVDMVMRPMLVYGIPMAFTVKFKMIVELGFSSKNSTAKSLVSFKLSGPIGVTGNQPVKPAASKANDPAENTQNLSLAPFGLVYAFEIKFMFGLGVPQFLGGIYAKLTVSLGLWSEGTMGMTHCEAGLLTGDVTVGIGYTLSSKAKEYWTKFLGGLGPGAKLTKLETEKQFAKVPFLNFPWAKPNSNHCKLLTS